VAVADVSLELEESRTLTDCRTTCGFLRTGTTWGTLDGLDAQRLLHLPNIRGADPRVNASSMAAATAWDGSRN
jgi:hypothetical protein